jgi:hypothetical protein
MFSFFLVSGATRTSLVFYEIYTARVRHPDMVMEDEGSSSNRGERKLRRPSQRLPLHHPARSLVRSLAWIGLLALARVAVLHPPLVAMKVKVRVVGVMSK